MTDFKSNNCWATAQEAASQFSVEIERLLPAIKEVNALVPPKTETNNSIPELLLQCSKALQEAARYDEAEALDQVYDKVTRSISLGGLEISNSAIPSQEQYNEAVFALEAWIESIKSKQNSRGFLASNPTAVANTPPMTLAQKIFTQHVLGSDASISALSVGAVVRVGIDWILASELSWSSMAETYTELGEPGIWRNDRFWLAGDHVVHPKVATNVKIKAFVDRAEKARRDFRMTEYQGMNYTIMHTEFVRERAEPGMLVLGSDSHTCSAGAVGCLAIGLGTADVMVALSLGETWFKIPESIRIELVGEPNFAISGKDVILHILKELKRNTVAADRIVEFDGEGARHLSCDARFAICNMCTEFGAITGVFVPDEVTQDYVQKRRRKANRENSVYFKPDEGAPYASHHKIDLSAVQPSIAIYPNPDDVVPVSEKKGMPLNGVFIGACTTTEEELVLAALVLKAGLERKLPLAKGKRHYVPGSLPIVSKLKALGLLEIYKEAGFTRGPPGCSMCVGLSAEKASEGETWLSSQNRNFENRMGKGSFGHVTSAIVCAASAFDMTVTDPADLLKDADADFYRHYKGNDVVSTSSVSYVEPKPNQGYEWAPEPIGDKTEKTNPKVLAEALNQPNNQTEDMSVIKSKIVTLGNFIDTDALAPGPTLTTCKTDAEFGAHVLEYTHPNFRSQVAAGQQIVVAGNAFGVGSSRECAVSALKGAGVKAVIARSFAFIYSRNQPSLGLLGIVMEDEEFYQIATDGSEIFIDVPKRTITVGFDGEDRSFSFVLSQMEYQLTVTKGIAQAYGIYGKTVWEKLMAKGEDKRPSKEESGVNAVDSRLAW